MIDIHCHVLPAIDDGSRTIEESLEVLRRSKEQGIDGIFATSHYYPDETAEEFISKRDNALSLLNAAKEEAKEELPSILPGAEVFYHVYLAREENIQKLCLGNSHYLLLEMPFKTWNSQVLSDVDELYSYKGLTPVIAHLERYFDMEDKKLIKELRSLHVMIQMNAEYIIDKDTRKNALKLIKKGMVDVLGSDCHGNRSRKQNLKEALDILENCGFGSQLDGILENNNKIWAQAQTVK